tara:strand:+ start:131 stop:505 length:375 start_codon:yes stop_codon:yes gene_type:complete
MTGDSHIKSLMKKLDAYGISSKEIKSVERKYQLQDASTIKLLGFFSFLGGFAQESAIGVSFSCTVPYDVEDGIHIKLAGLVSLDFVMKVEFVGVVTQKAGKVVVVADVADADNMVSDEKLRVGL